MLKKGEKKFDQEWISLMKEAYYLGLSIAEVKKFIYSKQKEPESFRNRLFLLLISYIMLTTIVYDIQLKNRKNSLSSWEFFLLRKSYRYHYGRCLLETS
ncbi:DNA-binding anti-repressor SinI [Priestia megaterium]|uniref:DNA-binding anti-repressor SinI n=1 Tax=Priestia megaterium TaxID=1404 RepID=UPI00366D7B72